MDDHHDPKSDGTPTDNSTQVNDWRRTNGTITAGGLSAWGSRRLRVAVYMLGILGVVTGAAGAVFADARTILFALCGTGLFAAVLLYVLIPERLVTATLAQRTYAPLAEIGPLLVDTIGLLDRRVYVPVQGNRVRLVIPDGNGTSVAEDGTLGFDTYHDNGLQGVELPTTGDELLAEFRDRTTDTLATDAQELVMQLLDVLVEEFELVEGVNGRAQPSDDRAVITVERSHYGPPTTFDHPVTAFLAAGLAAGLETPVSLDPIQQDEYGRYVISCRWQDPVETATERER